METSIMLLLSQIKESSHPGPTLRPLVPNMELPVMPPISYIPK